MAENRLPGEKRTTIRKGNLPHTGDGKTQAKGKIRAESIEFKHRTQGRDSRLRAIADGEAYRGKRRGE